MNFWELVIIAIALSMDAFAVAVCKGLALPQYKVHNSIAAGLYFGIFQAFMPLLGYIIGSQFTVLILNVGHLIAFAVLTIIGINMIRESKSCANENKDCSFGFKRMVILSLATSIDAFAIGISFAFLKADISSALITIGITTFIISFAGVKLGNMFKGRYKSKAETAGGIILILMGVKMLLEHFGIVSF
ncbi:MAG: manganese efflux pump MntP family protein [Christensenellales bacterium]